MRTKYERDRQGSSSAFCPYLEHGCQRCHPEQFIQVSEHKLLQKAGTRQNAILTVFGARVAAEDTQGEIKPASPPHPGDSPTEYQTIVL